MNPNTNPINSSVSAGTAGSSMGCAATAARAPPSANSSSTNGPAQSAVNTSSFKARVASAGAELAEVAQGALLFERRMAGSAANEEAQRRKG